MRSPQHSAEYVLPLRWDEDADLPELTGYLAELVVLLDVTVVDGSRADLFERHRAAFPAAVRHLAPAAWPGANGKARGVMTGIQAARHDRVVIADDDVRYDAATIAAVLHRLGDADLVRPQNVFRPSRWHARWDTGRTLLNRVWGGDYSGTLGVRRSFVLARGGYDGDVLFENLELERTVLAHGGRVDVASDVFVVRLPPTPAQFWNQRVRQAYDDFAQPARLALHLAILPALGWALSARRPGVVAAGAAAAIGLAEVGRRRDGGAAVFDGTAALWAPVWLLERALAIWIALGCRLRGGVRYRDTRIFRAASSIRSLRRRSA
ncbi:glycosyltransferase [Micromonospora sp. DT81.3]|uniref:glycosyltransferase n=1 Tax=Actinomycetes TaxID=1760 RepID=UPI003CE77A6B